VSTFFAEHALLPDGWAGNVRIETDAAGWILAVVPDGPRHGAELLRGPVLPGMPNAHCHAFQRAMAGLAERSGETNRNADSFWTWRERMYAFLQRLTPEHAHAIARQLYVELLKHGYTAVAEFHYVHRRPDGSAYAPPTAMAAAHLAAARDAGIAITLLPALYAYGGFGGRPLSAAQRRFATTPDDVLQMVAILRGHTTPDARIGVAPHSLRAVDEAALSRLLGGLPPDVPVHIHLAEQLREVADCVAWSGQRPAQWLLERFPVDSRWCLVHATHLTDAETDALAASDAAVVLCPTTEANLGDGLFPLARYLRAGGRLAIGSDSNVCRNPAEELRWLEYGQRLHGHARAVAATAPNESVGTRLWTDALAGGAQCMDRRMAMLVPGTRADLVVLDAAHPALDGLPAEHLLDALVFATDATPVRDVMVGGRWLVRDGQHAREDEIALAWAAARADLLRAA
jgi:formimidoylglutamate deiminase